MPLREKTAWITVITILVCLGVYVGALSFGLVTSRTWASFHLGIICIVALVVLQVALNIAAAVLSPKDSRGPRDERDLMIHARSHVVGYYVLMIGMAAVLISTHIPVHGLDFIDVVFNTVGFGILVMLVAAMSVAVAQIIMYRRGT